MPIRTGRQYLDSLRDGRDVHGRPLADVPDRRGRIPSLGEDLLGRISQALPG